MFRARKLLNRWSFTPWVQDSDGQSDSKHFDEESRDYLLSNSCKNQSECDRESTDDGSDLFTNHQVHLSTSRQWLRCVWHLGFVCLGVFSLLIEIISIAKFLIIVLFLVWKHEKQTLCYITQNLNVIETPVCLLLFFSSNLFCGSTGFSAPTLKITWAWEVDAPEITWYE